MRETYELKVSSCWVHRRKSHQHGISEERVCEDGDTRASAGRRRWCIRINVQLILEKCTNNLKRTDGQRPLSHQCSSIFSPRMGNSIWVARNSSTRDEMKNRLREIGKAYHQQDMVDFDEVTVKATHTTMVRERRKSMDSSQIEQYLGLLDRKSTRLNSSH